MEPPKGRLKSFLAGARDIWAILLQAAAWISTVVAGFLRPPEFVGQVSVSGLTPERLSKLAEFIFAVLFGVAFATIVRSRYLRSVWAWSLVTVGALVLAVTLFFLSLVLGTSWTCSSANTRVVIGSELTPHGVKYVEQGRGRGQTCEFWLDDHAGKVTDIWTLGSILRREIVLLIIYIATVLLFGLCIMAAIQAVSEAIGST
jgi:hypothetical protein